MSIDVNKLSEQELREHNESQAQHSNDGQESPKVDEITIVIRGGKVVKFEQRFV